MAGRKGNDILDLTPHLNKPVMVKFTGGREVVGTLKGFDPLVNLVLFDAVETLQDPSAPMGVTERDLGVVVCRGTAVQLVCPKDGMVSIANPFGGDE